MKRIWLTLALLVPMAFAQSELSPAEQESLRQALGEAGNSAVDFVRAIENHLAKFPNSPKRAELERTVAKASVDLNDDKRVVLYGERVLSRDPDDLQLLEKVAVALLHNGDKTSAEKALRHAKHLEQLMETAAKNDKSTSLSGREEANRKDQTERGEARALLLQARAQGFLDHADDAIKLAEASYSIFPSVEAGREAARWLSAAGKNGEAIQYLADAFTIAGLRSSDSDGARDRAQMGELYRKLNGSEAGLGDVILKAYDRTAAQLAARRAQLREYDPNVQIKNPMEFTLSGPDGDKLKLSSLLGKVVVMDFWATWCGPCRVQHPLYEQVKAKYKSTDEVVFLAVDTDEDRSLVKPFVQSQNWTHKVYFEDGLSRLLQVSSIPSTIIFNKKGEVVSRMNGFLPDRFVDMLTERIEDALEHPAPAAKAKGASLQ